MRQRDAQPYDQGVAVAATTLAALLGLEVPAWIVLPALDITRERVAASYRSVLHTPAPPELLR